MQYHTIIHFDTKFSDHHTKSERYRWHFHPLFCSFRYLALSILYLFENSHYSLSFYCQKISIEVIFLSFYWSPTLILFSCRFLKYLSLFPISVLLFFVYLNHISFIYFTLSFPLLFVILPFFFSISLPFPLSFSCLLCSFTSPLAFFYLLSISDLPAL